jgi:hypothetical protein
MEKGARSPDHGMTAATSAAYWRSDMRSLSFFVTTTVVPAIIVVAGCASTSQQQSETMPWSRATMGDGVGGLWIASDSVRPEGDLRASHSLADSTSGLWMKSSAGAIVPGGHEKETPRLDRLFELMNPSKASATAKLRDTRRTRQ